MANIPEQAIRDAWADSQKWAETEFPAAVVDNALPDQRVTFGFSGSETPIVDPGLYAVQTYGVTICGCDGVSAQEASFPDPATAQLPLGLSELSAAGKFRFDYVYEGQHHESYGDDSGYSGTDIRFHQTLRDGRMIFTVSSVGERLTVTGVSFDGWNRSSHCEELECPDSLAAALRDAIPNVFDAGLDEIVIAAVNKHLGA